MWYCKVRATYIVTLQGLCHLHRSLQESYHLHLGCDVRYVGEVEDLHRFFVGAHTVSEV